MSLAEAPLVGTASKLTRAEKRYVIGGKVSGRNPALVVDEKTISTLVNCGKIHCTDEEAAAVLGVAHSTLQLFFEDVPEAKHLLHDARLGGKQSLRRLQWKMAKAGNAAMAIFLGKQYLGQTDKSDMAVTVDLRALVMAAREVAEPGDEVTAIEQEK